MLIANNWKEYKILDAGEGSKLERWGANKESYLLDRPDPQILWPKEKPEIWNKADGVYIRDAKGKGGWQFPDPSRVPPEKWQILYGDLKFWISPTSFKHTGLFPEQAVNWDWMAEKIKGRGASVRVLNLFAYTGAATVACAKAGAEVTHVDAAKGMVDSASDNAKLNGIDARWIVDDVVKFVEREARRGAKYDGIVMDPPSYGRGKTGETWKIEKMLWPLVESTAKILSDKPLFFILNSYTTGLGSTVIKNILESATKGRAGEITADEICLPIEDSQKLLPAGVTGRWSA